MNTDLQASNNYVPAKWATDPRQAAIQSQRFNGQFVDSGDASAVAEMLKQDSPQGK